MKIALLVCDDSHKTLPHNSGSYVDMFVQLFELIEHKVELIPYNVQLGMYPDDLSMFDGFLSTGSSFSVYEDVPWIYELKNFIRELFENGHKYFGVCFGHQLIAQSLGGKVEKSHEGWMVGVKQTDIIKQEPWMEPQESHCMVISSHQDQITELPPEAETIGQSKECRYSMIKVADHFVGFQGHPEFRKAYATALMESRRDLIAENIIKAAKQSFRISPDQKLLATWIYNFISGNFL